MKRGWNNREGLLAQIIDRIYPPQCLACGVPVAEHGGLCAACWSAAGFPAGALCDLCATPLPGDEAGGGPLHCESCLTHPPPWAQGRAAMTYAGTGRDLVLALKHGDRQDLVPTLGLWLWRAGQVLLRPGQIVAPVPLHWRRYLRRRGNQSALLAAAFLAGARADGTDLSGTAFDPALLRRIRHTPSQDGRSVAQRAENLSGALVPGRRWRAGLAGRPVLLIDDVMTSGATLAEATRVLQAAGAGEVRVLVLARVAKPD